MTLNEAAISDADKYSRKGHKSVLVNLCPLRGLILGLDRF